MHIARAVFLACAGLFLLPSSAHARLCTPPKVVKDSPYSYMVSLANALVRAKEGLGRVDDAATGDDAYALLIRLKLQKSDYECAEAHVAPYAASSDTVLRSSATTLARIFQRLSNLDDAMVSECRALLDSTGKVTPATMAERQAEVQSSLEQTWGLLVHAVALSTYTVVEADPTTGRMSRLALTQSQREEILRVLRAGFGPSVMGGMQEDQHYLVAAAAALYQVIADPKRQSRKAM
jgi:hypothetical protein